MARLSRALIRNCSIGIPPQRLKALSINLYGGAAVGRALSKQINPDDLLAGLTL
jgi:hypothetical protein